MAATTLNTMSSNKYSKENKEGRTQKTFFLYPLSFIMKEMFYQKPLNSLPHISYSAKVGHLHMTRSITGKRDWSCYVALDKSLTKYGPGPNPDWCLFLWIKFYWNTVTPINVHTNYDCFVLQWQNWRVLRDHMNYLLLENIYYLAFY